MTNIFYFDNLNVIGGVESFLFYLAKTYPEKDITVYYRSGDINQIRRLKRYVRVKCYEGERIKCKRAFFNYRPSIIDFVDAEEYIQVIHMDYVLQGDKPEINPKMTRYIGVSKEVCKHFYELTGIMPELVYNPINPDEPKRVLKLVSATRLTKEKGKERMERLGNLLNFLDIPYLWLVFTNSEEKIDNPNIIYMSPKLDISSYIKDADFLVQLSTSESYCYAVVESLLMGTPVIVTDLGVYKEIGLNNSNSIKLPLDFTKIDKNKLLKSYKFKYTPPKTKWGEVLGDEKSTYKCSNKKITLKYTALIPFTCVKEGEVLNEGDTVTVDEDRADEILIGHRNCFEIIN